MRGASSFDNPTSGMLDFAGEQRSDSLLGQRLHGPTFPTSRPSTATSTVDGDRILGHAACRATTISDTEV